MLKKDMPKISNTKDFQLTLTRKEFDYIQESLDWHANDGSTHMTDKIGQKLVEAWNNGYQKQKYKVKPSR